MDQIINDKAVLYFTHKSFKILRYPLFFLMFFTVIFPLKSYAVPACDGLFELKQPMGFSFEARKGGDEWDNWIETKEGYGIYKNTTTGNWEYYMPSIDTVSANGRAPLNNGISHAVVGETDPASIGIQKGLRPPDTSVIDAQLSDLNQNILSQKKLLSGSEEGVKNTAISGAMHLLVIAVDYTDTAATYAADQIQPLLFGDSGSVSDYYRKTSYSSVAIIPAIESYGTSNDGFIGWLRLDGNHPNPGSSVDKRNQQITKDAILAADPYTDYSLYDDDGDGIIEPAELSVMVIVAGYEAAALGSGSPSVWAHYRYMDAVGYPTVDGKTIQQYAQFGERHGDHLATIGVMAHELGHLMFRLTDLYDTDTSNGDSLGVGYFDLMSNGSWAAASGAHPGSSPTQLSAWSKEYLSWGTVNIISSGNTVPFSFPKADGNKSSIFRIDTSDSNQYFLIENRQFSGYDVGFQRRAGDSGHGGLVIYHIDTLKATPQSRRVNADEDDKGVDVEEANEGSLGYSMLDTVAYSAHTDMFFFSGNNTDFTDSTAPSAKLKNGEATDIAITNISAYGDTMTAAVTVPARPPIVTTGLATNVTSSSAILNGTVNANGLPTTAWFEYGTISGSYGSSTSPYTVGGTNGAAVSVSINGILPSTTYYYKLAAQNSAGTASGNEISFTTLPPTPTPTPTPTPMPTPSPSPTPTATPLCEANLMEASPKTLKLKTEETGEVTVTVAGSDGCAVAGEIVKATIKSGKKQISVTPLSQDTDTNGKAVFTITATKKSGNAKVKFKSGVLKDSVQIKIMK
ncbi:MAG: M6 family metalloprotease domain-containing protein [Candidatus Brocadia sp.]|nr:M6 family metalloprotease domain-containing protein [Candidatus Brocadia sp.]